MKRKLLQVPAIMAALAMIHAVFAEPAAKAPPALTADANGALHLPAEHAIVTGGTIRVETHEGLARLGHWRDPADTASWKMRVPTDGRYLVRIETAAEAAGAVLLIKCNGKLALSVPASGSAEIYKTSRVGEVTLAAKQDITLTLKPVVDGWQPIHVRKVELIPLP
ncbi:MAG TPA: hypothetical protein VLO11_11225 [Luteolibacter sp.]|nr:hypothetical protein [Luteolibacter sp.]